MFDHHSIELSLIQCKFSLLHMYAFGYFTCTQVSKSIAANEQKQTQQRSLEREKIDEYHMDGWKNKMNNEILDIFERWSEEKPPLYSSFPALLMMEKLPVFSEIKTLWNSQRGSEFKPSRPIAGKRDLAKDTVNWAKSWVEKCQFCESLS